MRISIAFWSNPSGDLIMAKRASSKKTALYVPPKMPPRPLLSEIQIDLPNVAFYVDGNTHIRKIQNLELIRPKTGCACTIVGLEIFYHIGQKQVNIIYCESNKVFETLDIAKEHVQYLKTKEEYTKLERSLNAYRMTCGEKVAIMKHYPDIAYDIVVNELLLDVPSAEDLKLTHYREIANSAYSKFTAAVLKKEYPQFVEEEE